MADYFRRRLEVVTAEQYVAGQPLPAGVVSIVYHATHGTVRSLHRPKDPIPAEFKVGLGVWTRGGWALVFPDDWIVTNQWGERWKHHARQFERVWEAVSAPPQTDRNA